MITNFSAINYRTQVTRFKYRDKGDYKTKTPAIWLGFFCCLVLLTGLICVIDIVFF